MMNVVKITDFDAFLSYEEELDNLMTRSHGRNLYLTFDYICSWLLSFNPKNLHFYFVYKNDELIAFLPLIRLKGFFASFQMAGSGLWGYSDLLVDTNHRVAVIPYLLEHVVKTYKMQLIQMGPIHGNSKNIPIIESYLERSNVKSVVKYMTDAPYVDTNSSFEEYCEKKISKKMLQDVKRTIKRLEEAGEIEYLKVNQKSNNKSKVISEYFEDYFEIYDRQWPDNRFRSDFRWKEFYESFANKALHKGFFELAILKLNGKPIAMHYGFLFQKSRYYFTPTYDVKYKKYSPGKILLYYLIKDSFEERVEFDFQNGPEPYKYEWTNKVQQRFFIDIYSNFFYWMIHLIKLALNKVLKKMLGFFNKLSVLGFY